MKPLRFSLRHASALGPGLASLAVLRALARGEHTYAQEPMTLPAPPQLPAAERRRASQAVRLVLACVAQMLDLAGEEATQLRSVFATDEGTGEVCQQMLQALATTRQVSPLVFTNSVHNAPSGYFSIASRNTQSATVVSMGLESFACGLLCAVTEAVATRQAVLLVACDPAMTAPLDELLPIREGTACAWIIDAASQGAHGQSLGQFTLGIEPHAQTQPSPIASWLPDAWSAHSSALGLTALGLLDAPANTVMRLQLGGQSLLLQREAGMP